MTAALLYTTVQVGPTTAVTPLRSSVRVGAIGNDLLITGEPADLIRLSDALRQAALRAIDAKVAAAREVAS